MQQFAGRYSIRGPLPWNGRFRLFEAEESGRRVVLAVAPRRAGEGAECVPSIEALGVRLELLSHPSIVPVIDSGIVDGYPYVEMEWVNARTLSDVMRNERVTAARAERIVRDVRAAIVAAHARGIVHGDVHPGNVLLVNDDGIERALVLGFGFRALLGDGEATARDDLDALDTLRDAMPASAPTAPFGLPRPRTDVNVLPLDFANDAPCLPLHEKPCSPNSDPPPHEIARRDSWMAPKRRVLRFGPAVLGGAVLAAGAFIAASFEPMREPVDLEPTVAVHALGSAPSASPLPISEVKAVDLFATEGVPAALREILSRLDAGGKISRNDLATVHRFVRRHPQDVRGHLLLGHSFARLHWYSAALGRYRKALRLDPRATEDPRLLTTLLDVLVTTDLDASVVPLLVEHYGASALPKVREALASASPRGASDLATLLARLESSR